MHGEEENLDDDDPLRFFSVGNAGVKAGTSTARITLCSDSDTASKAVLYMSWAGSGTTRAVAEVGVTLASTNDAALRAIAGTAGQVGLVGALMESFLAAKDFVVALRDKLAASRKERTLRDALRNLHGVYRDEATLADGCRQEKRKQRASRQPGDHPPAVATASSRFDDEIAPNVDVPERAPLLESAPSPPDSPAASTLNETRLRAICTHYIDYESACFDHRLASERVFNASLAAGRDGVVQGGLIGSATAMLAKDALGAAIAVSRDAALVGTQTLAVGMAAAHITAGVAAMTQACSDRRAAHALDMHLREPPMLRGVAATAWDRLSMTVQCWKRQAVRLIGWSAGRIAYGAAQLGIGSCLLFLTLAGPTAFPPVAVAVLASLSAAWLIFAIYKTATQFQESRRERMERKAFFLAVARASGIADSNPSEDALRQILASKTPSWLKRLAPYISQMQNREPAKENSFYVSALLAKYLGAHEPPDTGMPMELVCDGVVDAKTKRRRKQASAMLVAAGMSKDKVTILKWADYKSAWHAIHGYLNGGYALLTMKDRLKNGPTDDSE